MSKALFLGAEFQGIDDNGNPLAGGLVYFYEATTTTDKDVFTDSTLNTKHFQPVVLDANGRAAIWMTGNYKVVLRDSAGVLIYDEDNVNTEASSVTTSILNNSGSVPLNGSFELDNIISGTPDYWAPTPYTNGSVGIDTSNQIHGLKCLKFTATDSNGAGEVICDRFDTHGGGEIELRFSYFTTDANLYVKVELLYANAADNAFTSSTPHVLSGSNPLTWTEYTYKENVPSGMVRGWIRITVLSSTATLPAYCYFDHVTVIENPSGATAFRGALAFTSVDISIPNGTPTYLNLNSTEYSTDLIHVLTAGSRLTVPSGVTKVRLSYKVLFEAGTGSIRIADIHKNKNPFYTGRISEMRAPVVAATRSGTTTSGTTSVINVVSGDYFEIQVYQNESASVPVIAVGGGHNTWFAMEIIE